MAVAQGQRSRREEKVIDRRLAAGIRWSFLGLAFFLPLLVSTRSSEVFELPKMVFVYGMTGVICGLWLTRIVIRREVLIRRTPLDIPILLFLISQIASTIYSIDPHVSWWGWYGRFHGGLWSTISYTLLYYALVSNIQIRNPNTEIRNKSQIPNDKNPKRSVWDIGILNLEFVPIPSRILDKVGISNFARLPASPKLQRGEPARQGFRVSNLIFVILSSALVAGIYALLQHFGIDKDFWVQDVVNRVFSTQGQPNWLAAYLVMVILITWMAAISDIKNHKSYMISYFLFMIFTLALLWTKSRSGLLGLAVADIVFWSLIFFRIYLVKKKSYIERQRPACHRLAAKQLAGRSFKKEPTFLGIKRLYRLSTIVHNLYNSNKPNKAVSPVGTFFFIHSILIVLILTTNNPAREWVLNRRQATSIPAMESGISLRKSEHGGTESGDIRAVVWSGAVQLVKQRPISGFGPETFGETYWRVRPKEHNLTSEWNFLYNKAHNEWLNLAANTGLFGLGSHILLLVWFIVWSFNQLKIRNPKSEIRNNDQNSNDKNSKLRVSNFRISNLKFVSNFEIRASDLTIAAILAAIVGVEAVNFFGFSTVTVGVYRYLFMAIGVTVASGRANKLLKNSPDRQDTSVIKIISGLLKSMSDRAVSSVIQDDRNRDKNRDLSETIGWRQKIIAAALTLLILYLISQVFIFFLADLAYNRGRAYQDGGYIEEAMEPLMRAVNLAPGEPVFRAELGEAEGVLAATLLSQERTLLGVRQGESLKDDAIANFEIIRKQSPYNLGFIRTQARILFLLGEQDKAVQLMKAAMELAPTNPQFPYSLGVMLDKLGKTDEAALYYNKAVELKPDYAVIPISE